MSKGQTKKKVSRKVKGISIEMKPFNAKELTQLQMILEKPHWGRRKMKDEFIAENNRLSEEVDAYIMANRKRKANNIDSPRASRENESQTDRETRDNLRTMAEMLPRSPKKLELAFPIEGVRFDNNNVIITVKIPE